MTTILDPSAHAYDKVYGPGTELLIKVGGEEIDSERFPQLIGQLKELHRQGLILTVVTGAGTQIDRHYGRLFPGRQRRKHEGKGVTDDGVLEASRRAALEVEKKFADALGDDLQIVPVDCVECEPDRPELGHVGVPTYIDDRPGKTITLVGSRGVVAGKEVNVNADEIALKIAEQRKALYAAFFLTPTGGVIGRDGKRVSLLDEQELEEITRLAATHPTVPVDGGMKLKLEIAEEMIRLMVKTAITRTDQLEREMRTSEGSGTLCYHSSMLGSSPIEPHEKSLFRAIHAKNVESKAFRKRSEDEVEELLANAYTTRVKKAAIGFFALKTHKDGTVELSAVSAPRRNGTGKHVMQSALQLRPGEPMYALSNEGLIDFFTKNGLLHLGKVSVLRHKADMPALVREYAIPDRDPEVFMRP